jgi:hypothetical protein
VEETVLAFTLKETEKLLLSYSLPPERAESALVQSRGRAAALDALARLWSEAEQTGATGPAAPEEQRSRKPRVRQTHGYAY